MVEVELGLEGEDVLVELTVSEDLGIKPPVIKVPYSPSELLILNGRALEGFLDPEGQNFCWIECGILGGGVNLLDVGEVPCSVVLAMACDAAVVELLDPLCHRRDFRLEKLSQEYCLP